MVSKPKAIIGGSLAFIACGALVLRKGIAPAALRISTAKASLAQGLPIKLAYPTVHLSVTIVRITSALQDRYVLVESWPATDWFQPADTLDTTMLLTIDLPSKASLANYQRVLGWTT